jgi:UDP-2,3-diacylglucosamine hydrolase
MISAAPDISSPVGVIAGGGAMPFAVADQIAARGINPVLFALRGACDPVEVERFRHHWIAVGQLGRATKLFREEGCRDLIFIGTLMRPALSEVRLDFKTLRLLGNVIRAFRGGDDHLLSSVGRIFEQDGFRMVGIRDVAPDLLMPEGCITRAAPDGGAEGRLRTRPARGVLVKAPKSSQDLRYDLPTVGPRTVEGAAKAELAGIAVAAGHAIVFEPQAMIEAADKAGLFVQGMGA